LVEIEGGLSFQIAMAEVNFYCSNSGGRGMSGYLIRPALGATIC